MTAVRRQEAGFTIVEVLVAAVILVVGAMATFGMLSTATRNTERAKETQVALDLAQQEGEALRSLSHEELAMTATPSHSTNSLNPNYRVNSGAGTFAIEREPVGSYQKLVVNEGTIEGGKEEETIEGGVVSPGPTKFENGDVTGSVYRYVVWRNDATCGSKCPTQQDYKQIVIAVKLDTPGNQAGERGYVEVQSSFIDPVDSAEKDPVPDAEGDIVTAQQFFLSDTPCDADGSTERADITGVHLLHNTRGTCASGLRSGETLGAPDALLLGGPPDPYPEDPLNPPLYDYADDWESTPDTDKGLQIKIDETGGCHFDPTATTNPEASIHRWVTDPAAAPFTMSGKVTIEFYTRAMNDEQYYGQLCVYLFDREEEEGEGGEPVAHDTHLTNLLGGPEYDYWTFTPEGDGYWPTGEWEKRRLTMEFNGAPHTILEGHRLGVALSVERTATSPANAILLMYDHPRYPTRLEVDTTTPLEGG